MKCVICDQRPARSGAYCHVCEQRIQAERRRKQTPKPAKYIKYRGRAIALFPNGKGKLRAEAVRTSLERLPKTKTIDLDTYVKGYTRDQVKQFKAAIAKLCY